MSLQSRFVTTSLLSSLVLAAVSSSIARASAPANDYSKLTSMIRLPKAVETDAKGLKFDQGAWKVEKEEDGTELYTLKKGADSRAAVLKDKEGALESVTSFQLAEKKTETAKTQKTEDSSSVFFKDGRLTAYTQCEDKGETAKSALGRICITATPKLCRTLRAGSTIEPETIKEIDVFEMRAIALLLTLRGSDHQLDNLVRSGNRLGLKSALQTTKGQLIALSKQVTKETAPKDGRAPAKLDEKAREESERARTVIEVTFPRLKQACSDTGFFS